MKTDFSKIKVGEVFSEVQYYKVIKFTKDKVQLKNGLDQDIVVDKDYLEGCLTSGEQYTKEEKMSKTDIAKLFLENPNVAFTVSFNKQVKEADVVKEIMDAYEGSSVKTMETAIKKAVKKALNGEERILSGYHNGIQDDFGRVNTRDLNIEDANSMRLVDTRSINWLIVKGTKYITK